MILASYWTVTEAAWWASVTPQAIRKAIRQGKLKAVKKGHQWLIATRALDAWATQRLPAACGGR